MKLKNGRITILMGEETMIELQDADSGITFARINLNATQLAQALGRLSMTHCDIEVTNSETFKNLGKVMENETHTFELPDNIPSYKRREKGDNFVFEEALRTAPEGWQPDNYFSSQNSFFEKDGKQYARCTIRRWV